MPPLYHLLKNDGPACRVCGCTEHNACIEVIKPRSPHPRGSKRLSRFIMTNDRCGCHWVKVEGATPPLCSACSGTESDMAEAITRGCRLLEQCSSSGVDMAVIIGKAALARRKRREKANQGT